MSDWKQCLLGSIAEVQTGPFGSQLKNEQYITGGTPVITVEHINTFRIQNIDYPSVTEDDRQRLARYSLNAGDIVFTRVGSVDLSAYVKPENQGWLFSSRMLRVRVSTVEVDSLFLSYFFRQEKFREYILNIAVGATMPSINTQILKDIPISYPPLPEQKAIASVLSSLDDKIDLLHRQNKTLEAMAETLFRQWFIEEAKEDWLTVQVKDIVKQIKPGTNYQPKRLESGIPFLNVRNLKNGQIDLQGISFISQEEYERVHKAWKPEVGDVLISRIGTLGIVAVLGKRDMPMAVHYNMLVLKPNLTNTAFLYFLLRSQYFQDLYSSKARQSVQEYVAVEDAEAIELKLPLNDADFVKKEEQFSDLFNKIRANLAQIQTLEKLRDTLLPKLMSGEVRVQLQTEEVA